MSFSSYYAGSIPVLNTEEDVNEYLETIKVNFANQRKLEKALRTRIKELEDEHYKDNELREMTLKLAQVRADANRGFPIWENESEAIAAWKKKHDTEVHGNPKQYHGASGGGYSYRFYPTGVGTLGQCVCLQCDKYALIKSEGDPKKYYKLLEERDGRFTFSEL